MTTTPSREVANFGNLAVAFTSVEAHDIGASSRARGDSNDRTYAWIVVWQIAV